jgi:arabinan endo-1,5-alpha-L-arabinosidase
MRAATRSLFAVSLLAAASCEPDGRASSTTNADDVVRRGTFTNAVLAQDCPDPGVIHVGDTYTMACTGGSFRLRQSPDLVTWTDTGKAIFPEGKPPWASDGRRDWAPEIHALDAHRFVAYYTASDARGKLAIGVATASDPLGPWTDRGAPLVQHDIGVIDATFFLDDDGRRYLYYKIDGNQLGAPTPILVRELAEDGLSFLPGSSEQQVLVNDPSTWEGGVVEAPWIVKRDGIYFLFYSGNVYDFRYATGVARGSSPRGPFEKKGAAILTNNASWVGPGHGSIVRARDAEWFVHHAWVATPDGRHDGPKGRWVLLEKIVWADGWPTFAGGSSSVTEQPMP